MGLDKDIYISNYTRGKYNSEYLSNGTQWDNTKVVQYCNEHKKEIMQPTISIFKKIKNWFNKKIIGLYSSNMEALPGGKYGRETTNRFAVYNTTNSWDLENWGIDQNDMEQVKNDETIGYKGKIKGDIGEDTTDVSR